MHWVLLSYSYIASCSEAVKSQTVWQEYNVPLAILHILLILAVVKFFIVARFLPW